MNTAKNKLMLFSINMILLVNIHISQCKWSLWDKCYMLVVININYNCILL